MDQLKQNQVIALYCGWKFNELGGPFEANWESANGTKWVGCPHYTKNLNAMHEAEKALTVDELIQQAEWIGACSNNTRMKDWVVLLKATAAQRAEAFLKTIGKWEE